MPAILQRILILYPFLCNSLIVSIAVFFYFLETLLLQVSLRRLSSILLLFCSIQYPSVHQ